MATNFNDNYWNSFFQIPLNQLDSIESTLDEQSVDVVLLGLS